ncbi:post-PEP-CTERM-1 domain-containing protein [Massilia antarctica]|uniref:post-PEP-CTERM-1 domain-containing protein n=1 Tax=Massilia antarctica TaxID=2765360 RepID=UPI0006BB9798|nr:hypothetical protein [Massilia sp. H27-R4]MCY0912814.1 hypothetical protein [Massilia sp. H27-R4]CUI03951.1 hypothetical protein BN2497_2679 [Janthinobacterium sp. CG23_2]CUU27737.1 hypothetical protein BN3177_2679 [Janthinobacterium sp. CG23_2]
MLSKTLITCCALAAVPTAAMAATQADTMAVVRDKQTGQLRPATAAELRAMEGNLRQPQVVLPQPQVRVRADGTRSAPLGGRGVVYSVVSRTADGKLVQRCVEDEAAARHAALSQAAPAEEHSNEQ